MRARSADDSSAVSLFPFLAVLVCTMGSLIVLLVVMTRQARLRAAQAPQLAGISVADQAAEAAQIELAIGRAEQSGARVTEQLAEGRLVLSHLEDRIRRLRDRMQELQRTATQLAKAGQSDFDQRRRDEEELARLKRLIADAKEQLSMARREARRCSYAIVPYRGESGTDRRPIYVECRADAVVLQPEGIVLEARDFAEPLGPGNPLAAALRAAREYYADRAASAGGGTDPYPLLLVRPDGIAAYYKVREAIASWDSEFGYELIEADWSLELPPPDPQLAQRESRAVEAARARQASLALAAPSQYGNGAGWRIRAAPRQGGFQTFIPNDTPAADEPFGHGSFASRRQSARPQTADRSPTGWQQTDDSRAEDRGANDRGAEDSGANDRGGNDRGADDRGTGDRGTGDYATGERKTADHPTGGDPTGGCQPVSRSPNGVRGGRATAFSGSLGSAPASDGPSGAGAVGGTFGTGPASSSNLATERGANWALPNAGRGAVPISRPVRVVLRHDRVVILPDGTTAAGTAQGGMTIPFSDRTADAVDQFVSTLWDYIDTWGIAGHGMYWRPVLQLHIAPDAVQRAVQFKELLEGSGLEFVEKGTIVR